MKRMGFLVAAAFTVLVTRTEMYAQAPQAAGQNKITITTSEGKDILGISSGEDGDNMVIRIASLEIAMKADNEPAMLPGGITHAENKLRRVTFGKSNYQAFFELGFNTLPGPNYSLYGSSAGCGLYDFMDLRSAKSLRFAFSLGDVTLYLDRQRRFALTTALQIVFDEYVFSNDVRLVKYNGMLIPEAIPPSYKKSKITTTSLQVPVIFTVGKSRSFHFSAGVYGGVRIGNHAKIKFPKEKTYDMYMAPFYGGLTVRAGFRGLYVYTNYALSDMFKKGKGPSVSPLTVGLGLGF